MTNLDDFDRALGEFLRDGPTVAPEPPVIAAMAHARTTPRRRDPFGAFRTDVMAPPVRLAGLRPGIVLAGAALILAALGIALLGGGRDQQAPPAPTETPSGRPSSTTRTVPMIVTAGGPLVVTVSDTSGFLLEATSLQPGDGGSVPEGEARIGADPLGDLNAMVVTWTGLPCETTGSVRVDEGSKTITVSRTTCGGDTVPLDRVLRLRFAGPAQAAAWRGFVGSDVASPAASAPASGPLPSGGPLSLHGSAGNDVPLEIVDGSGRLVEAAVASDPADVEFLTAANVATDRVRLTWPGSPCDTVYRLTIAADLGMTLDRPKCFGDALPSFYAIELTFDGGVDAGAFDLGLHDGRFASGLPTQTVIGLDAAGKRYDLTIFDASGRLSVPEPFSDGTQPPDPGPTGWTLGRRSDAIGRLVWRAPACAANQTLRIDAAVADWQLSWQPCEAPPEVLRVVDLEFDHLPDTTGITVTILGPQP
jgi:hypothetical protein